MKRTLLIILLIWSAGSNRVSAQDAPSTQRLFNEITFEIATKQYKYFDKQVTKKITVSGTFWKTTVNGDTFFLTAAHNLGLVPDSDVRQIDNIKIGADNRLVSRTVHPLLGTLAYEPGDLCLLDSVGDVALIRPSNPDALKESQTITISSAIPRIGDPVTVLGFPSTAQEKAKETRVASINQAQHFFTLNDELDKGYSGGVVLDKNHNAVGLVITTDAKQSNAILLTPELLAQAKWKPFKELQRKDFPAPNK